MWASFECRANRGAPKDRSAHRRVGAAAGCDLLILLILLSLQQNAPATQVRQLRLQGIYLPLADRQLQFHAVGREDFFHDQTAQFRYPKLHQRQLAKRTGTTDLPPD